MKISEKGLSMIERFEGCLLKASNKLDGVWTIGYGQTGSYYGKRVRRGMTTTKAEAHAWLRDHSIKTYEDAVTQAVKVPLNQHQFDALVSFANHASWKVMPVFLFKSIFIPPRPLPGCP